MSLHRLPPCSAQNRFFRPQKPTSSNQTLYQPWHRIWTNANLATTTDPYLHRHHYHLPRSHHLLPHQESHTRTICPIHYQNLPAALPSTPLLSTRKIYLHSHLPRNAIFLGKLLTWDHRSHPPTISLLSTHHATRNEGRTLP